MSEISAGGSRVTLLLFPSIILLILPGFEPATATGVRRGIDHPFFFLLFFFSLFFLFQPFGNPPLFFSFFLLFLLLFSYFFFFFLPMVYCRNIAKFRTQFGLLLSGILRHGAYWKGLSPLSSPPHQPVSINHATNLNLKF